jgi:hypothetical protein
MRTAIILSLSAAVSFHAINTSAAPVGEAFTLGAYYRLQSPTDNFEWDYGFMDMARIGCNQVVTSGNLWGDAASALKNWDMKAITAYSQLNNYPGPGNWPDALMTNDIILTKNLYATFTDGDIIIGHIMDDEPECRSITADEINYLRHWADLYHQYNPNREAWVNHCDPPWIDFNEKRASCSANATIIVNGSRITDRIAAVQAIGLPNFTTVSLQGYLFDWATSGGATDGCSAFNDWGMGPCADVRDWAQARTHHQDAYDMMMAAYQFGSDGYQPYIYNEGRGISFVDANGNDNYGIRTAFKAAAHDIRRSQGWPGVDMTNNGVEFNDRTWYSEGPYALAADAESENSTITKVEFGMSINKGQTWTTVEDISEPYSNVFMTFDNPGQKIVIFRAQAFDAAGKSSLFDANLIWITQ